jgi:ParB family chromosome partitioning protein
MVINMETDHVYEKGQLYQITLSDLQTDPNQPRKVIDPQALEELTTSIARMGVVQPIVFRCDDTNNLVIVAGERRVTAARAAGISTIPAIFIDGNYAEVALVENLLRQDLTPVEEAEAMQTLMTRQQYTQEQLGAIIGKAQNTLSEILSINRLPQEVRDDCRGNRAISRSALITIAKKKQARAMVSGYTAVKAKIEKGKTTRKKKPIETAQVAIDSIAKFQQKISTLDMTEWADADKTYFQTTMENLKAEIDNVLAAIAAPAQTSTATPSTRKTSVSKMKG